MDAPAEQGNQFCRSIKLFSQLFSKNCRQCGASSFAKVCISKMIKKAAKIIINTKCLKNNAVRQKQARGAANVPNGSRRNNKL